MATLIRVKLFVNELTVEVSDLQDLVGRGVGLDSVGMDGHNEDVALDIAKVGDDAIYGGGVGAVSTL